MSTNPPLREPRSRNKVLSAVGLVLAVLATMLAFSVASPASATEDECDETPDLEHSFDSSNGSGWVKHVGDNPLCDSVYVHATTWTFDNTELGDSIWPQTRSGVDTVEVSDSEKVPFQAPGPLECVQVDIYYTETKGHGLDQELTGPGEPFEPEFLHDRSAGPDPTWAVFGGTTGENGKLTEDCGGDEQAETWGFPVAKELVDLQEVVSPGLQFEVNISCAVEEGEPYEDTALIEAGQTVYFEGIPVYATPCTVTETSPGDELLADGYTWDSPSYSPDAEVSISDTQQGCGFPVVYLRELDYPESPEVEPCVTITNSYSPPPPPSIPDEDPEPEDPTVDASVEYSCDADGTVNLSSDGGSSDFVIEVDGVVVYDETLAGETSVDITVDGTTNVVVTADGEEVFSDEVEFEDCPTTTTEEEPDVGGIDEDLLGSGNEAPGDTANVGGESAEAGGGTLPRTGAGTGGLLLIAGLILGIGGVLRAASRRLA